MTQTFRRTIEDFRCGRCGSKVKGNGYTNHCPKCLWSRHVDVHPGDRAATCGGMMEPVRAEETGGERIIIHRCAKCGEERKVKTLPEDSADELVRIVREQAPAKPSAVKESERG